MRLVTVHIPLRRNDGTVRAYAVIDGADAPQVVVHRWSYLSGDYAMRHDRTLPGRPAILLHRQLMGLTRGDGLEVDHFDGDGLNNRRSNLRVCTRALNAQNRGAGRGSRSRYRGVAWHREGRKWAVNVSVLGRNHYLGLFDDEDDAGRAAAAWRAEHMPFSSDAATGSTRTGESG